jgi:hypothetical protein
MKQTTLTIILLTTFCANILGQDSVKITFHNVKKSLACYVASVVNNPSIRTAVMQGYYKADSADEYIDVTITEGKTVDVYRYTSLIAEGIAKEANEELLIILTPMLGTRPWLASQIMRVKAEREGAFGLLQEDGCRIIKEMHQAVIANE